MAGGLAGSTGQGERGRVGECFEFINNAGWQLPITFCLERLFLGETTSKEANEFIMFFGAFFCQSKLICEGLGCLPKFEKNLKIIDSCKRMGKLLKG